MEVMVIQSAVRGVPNRRATTILINPMSRKKEFDNKLVCRPRILYASSWAETGLQLWLMPWIPLTDTLRSKKARAGALGR